MKRILLSVFAVAITAAWAVPASAGDVGFGLEYRLRGEYSNNGVDASSADYDDNAEDSNDFWTQRVRLTANATATDDVTAKVTIQDTRTFGIGGDSSGLWTDVDSSPNNYIDVHEAYLNVADIFGTPIAFRAGRQELNYGDQRLIGGFGWSNMGRAFDGFKLMYTNDAVDVDAFTTTISEDSSTVNDDVSFSGVYATIKQVVPNSTVDVYLLNKNDNTSMTLYTLGFRVAGAMSGVDYTVEVPYQFGEASATSDYSAWAAAVKVGYTLPTAMKIRIGAEYDFATGTDATTTDTETFVSLYPTNHGHFGIGDIINTWSDISAWSLNASAQVTEQASIYVAYWDYTENEAFGSDHGSTGTSDELGSEIDLVGKYQYNNNVALEAGFSRFMPGDGITGGGAAADDARDWGYVQITANF